MSVFRPQKQAKTQNKMSLAHPSQCVDSENGQDSSLEEEKPRRITTSQTTLTPMTSEEDQPSKALHPKGHKVRMLEDVWKTMDKQSYLHLTDTLALGDVWVVPTSVSELSGASATVSFIQIVVAPHLKSRETQCKIGVDDLLRMIYLYDCFVEEISGHVRLDFDEWLNEKTAIFARAKGADDAGNRGKLAEFLLKDMKFCISGNMYVFFRKICYHSYKAKASEEKIKNPSMIKCVAYKGKFEYVIEGRILPLPEKFL